MEKTAHPSRDGDDIEKSLRGLFAGREAVAAGRFQVIHFERFREKLGDGWERYKERIKTIAEQVIARHLTRADLHIACRDLGFMVLFADLSPQEAELKARMITTEIARRVLGDDTAQAEDLMRSAVVALGREALLSSPDIVGTVDALVAESGGLSRAGAPPRPTTGRSVEPSTGGRVSYRLVWDVRRKVLSTYVCAIDRSAVAPPAHGGEARRLSELDLFALDRVGQDLAALRRKGKRALISCPVHFETLADRRHRSRFFDGLQGFPASSAQDLVIELAGFATGVPSGRLLELVAPVARLCRAAVMQVDLDHRSFSALGEAGIKTVSVEFAGRTDTESGLLELMNEFAQRASRDDMVLVASGLESRSMVIGALGAGFAYVEGKAIHQPVASPEQVVRFNIADLFAECVGNFALN